MSRIRMLFAAGVLAASGLPGGCGGGGGGAAVTRVDSAGVEIVTSGPQDVALDWRLEPRFTLGGEDEGPQSFYQVWAASVGADSAGRVYVLDSEAKRVVVFGPGGSYVRTMGQEGGGPGELKRAYWLDVSPDGTASVFDLGKMALVQWDAAGNELPERHMPFPLTMGEHVFTVADDGYYLSSPGSMAADTRTARLLHVVDEDTTVITSLAQPDNGVHVFESCHVGIALPPLFSPTLRWDYGDGALVVVDGSSYAIDIHRGGTRVRSVRRAIPPVQATDALAKAEVGDGMTIGIPGRGRCTIPADEVASARGRADVVPAIRKLAITPAGALWVQRWVPGEDEPPIDVFDPTGAYVGTLPAGTSFPVLFLPDDEVGIVSTDENDVQRLVIESVTKGESGG